MVVDIYAVRTGAAGAMRTFGAWACGWLQRSCQTSRSGSTIALRSELLMHCPTNG